MFSESQCKALVCFQLLADLVHSVKHPTEEACVDLCKVGIIFIMKTETPYSLVYGSSSLSTSLVVSLQTTVLIKACCYTHSDDLSKLKYLTMCIKESLRLHCPAPFIQRQTRNEIVIDGVSLPPGTVLDIQIYNLHHNPSVWEDPMISLPVV